MEAVLAIKGGLEPGRLGRNGDGRRPLYRRGLGHDGGGCGGMQQGRPCEGMEIQCQGSGAGLCGGFAVKRQASRCAFPSGAGAGGSRRPLPKDERARRCLSRNGPPRELVRVRAGVRAGMCWLTINDKLGRFVITMTDSPTGAATVTQCAWSYDQ